MDILERKDYMKEFYKAFAVTSGVTAVALVAAQAAWVYLPTWASLGGAVLVGTIYGATKAIKEAYA